MDRHCRSVGEAVNVGQFDVLFANACQFFRATPIGRHVRVPRVIYLQEPYRWLYEAMPTPPFMSPQPPVRSRFAPWYVRHRLKDYFTTPARRKQIRAEYESAAAFDRILVNSYFSRESVLRAYGLDATVCYLGVDATTFAPTPTPRGDFVLGLGALVPEKNPEFVIRAVAEVRPTPPRLVWVGNAQYPGYGDNLAELAGRLGVRFEPRVRVPQAEVVELLSSALALLYAPRLEPFGYAPLEANACGTPVVAVAEGGVRETVSDRRNGLLVEATPAAMAQAIEQLRDDPGLVRRLGETGRELVRTCWSFEAAIGRLEDNLRAVAAPLSERKAPS